MDLEDRGDDRQPQASALVRPGPFGTDAPERPGDLPDIVWVQDWSAVLDDEARALVLDGGNDAAQPPGRLWPTALSTTLSTRRESSIALPVTHASGSWRCSTSSPIAAMESARRSIARRASSLSDTVA